MKWRGLFFVMGIFFLQACQHTNDAQEEVNAKKKHRSDAAGYNVQLGLEYLKQGNIPRSKRKLLLALEQAPSSPDANAAMAYFMEKTGELDNAQSYYQKALAGAPGRGTQLNNYGAFLCRQGRYPEAERYFLKAVDDLQYEHTSGAYENAGLCAMAAADDVKAQRFFVKALEQDSSRSQSLYELVKLELKHERFDEARINLQKYPEMVLHSRELLALAVLSAHKAGKLELEAEYKRLLDTSGVINNDHNHNG